MEERSIFFPLWNKYRPVILKLMSDSTEGEQQYKFFNHEFKALNGKAKSFSFFVEITNGRPAKYGKQPPAASGLMQVLHQSQAAVQMMSENSFEFSLDRNFIFHVSRKE